MTGLAAVLLALAAPWGARANDAQIAKEIVGRLQEQQQAANLQGFDIGVQVDEGTVLMAGRVSTVQQQDLALDIARRVPGVKVVVNDMQVRQEIAAAPVGVVSGATLRQPQRVVPAPMAARQTVSPVAPVGLTQAAPQLVPDSRAAATSPGDDAMAQPVVAAAPAMVIPAAPVQHAAIPAARPASGLPPRPFAPARDYQTTLASSSVVVDGGVSGAPVPAHLPSAIPSGVARATYDHPNMPAYAWPSYASYPNYAALTYPQQYSPTAWPYIGPFYPYPQVPLGWRKVTLEWDDGWWMLDFTSKR